MKIYVGNLSYEVTEEDLRLELEQFAQVESATIIKDKRSGHSKGFGFVEMTSKAERQSAKYVNYNIGMNFETRQPESNHTIPSSKNLCDVHLKYVVLPA